MSENQDLLQPGVNPNEAGNAASPLSVIDILSGSENTPLMPEAAAAPPEGPGTEADADSGRMKYALVLFTHVFGIYYVPPKIRSAIHEDILVLCEAHFGSNIGVVVADATTLVENFRRKKFGPVSHERNSLELAKIDTDNTSAESQQDSLKQKSTEHYVENTVSVVDSDQNKLEDEVINSSTDARVFEPIIQYSSTFVASSPSPLYQKPMESGMNMDETLLRIPIIQRRGVNKDKKKAYFSRKRDSEAIETLRKFLLEQNISRTGNYIFGNSSISSSNMAVNSNSLQRSNTENSITGSTNTSGTTTATAPVSVEKDWAVRLVQDVEYQVDFQVATILSSEVIPPTDSPAYVTFCEKLKALGHFLETPLRTQYVEFRFGLTDPTQLHLTRCLVGEEVTKELSKLLAQHQQKVNTTAKSKASGANSGHHVGLNNKNNQTYPLMYSYGAPDYNGGGGSVRSRPTHTHFSDVFTINSDQGNRGASNMFASAIGPNAPQAFMGNVHYAGPNVLPLFSPLQAQSSGYANAMHNSTGAAPYLLLRDPSNSANFTVSSFSQTPTNNSNLSIMTPLTPGDQSNSGRPRSRQSNNSNNNNTNSYMNNNDQANNYRPAEQHGNHASSETYRLPTVLPTTPYQNSYGVVGGQTNSPGPNLPLNNNANNNNNNNNFYNIQAPLDLSQIRFVNLPSDFNGFNCNNNSANATVGDSVNANPSASTSNNNNTNNHNNNNIYYPSFIPGLSGGANLSNMNTNPQNNLPANFTVFPPNVNNNNNNSQNMFAFSMTPQNASLMGVINSNNSGNNNGNNNNNMGNMNSKNDIGVLQSNYNLQQFVQLPNSGPVNTGAVYNLNTNNNNHNNNNNSNAATGNVNFPMFTNLGYHDPQQQASFQTSTPSQPQTLLFFQTPNSGTNVVGNNNSNNNNNHSNNNNNNNMFLRHNNANDNFSYYNTNNNNSSVGSQINNNNKNNNNNANHNNPAGVFMVVPVQNNSSSPMPPSGFPNSNNEERKK